MKKRAIVALYLALAARLGFADTYMKDTFSWGVADTLRSSITNGYPINNVPPEEGSGTWATKSGSAVFTSDDDNNQVLRMTGNNTMIRFPAMVSSNLVAVEACGYFTPGSGNVKGFYMGLQADTSSPPLLHNEHTDGIYGRVKDNGTIVLTAAVDGTETTASGSVGFVPGDPVHILLVVDMNGTNASLAVETGVDLQNRTELSISWAGTLNCPNFAVDQVGNGTLDLISAGCYKLPRLPNVFPINMSFFALNGDDPDVNGIARASNYDVHHGRMGQPYRLKKNNPNSVVIRTDGSRGWTVNSGDKGDAPTVWPGFLMYYQGSKLASAITTTNDTRIYVQHPERFRSTDADYGGDHVVIYTTYLGKPNWDRYEYAKVTAVGDGYIDIARGTSGTTPKIFTANAVVAAHAAVWLSGNDQQWLPNFSLECPMNNGENAAMYFSDRVADLVLPAASNGTVVDGVEHDVFYCNRNISGRPMDCDNNLEPDWGYINGVNSFCLGIQHYAQNLRARLGPDKIIQFDSRTPRIGYRGWKYVNGIQMEGFMGFKDRFSEGFEHLSHWVEKAQAAPQFSYGFTKEPTETYGGGAVGDDWKFRVHFAAGLMVGMPHPYSSRDANGAWTGFFNWDEQIGGTLNDKNWLGKPNGPAIRDLSNLDSENLVASATWDTTLLNTDYAANTSGNLTDGLCIDVTGVQADSNNWHGVDLALHSFIQQETNQEYTLTFTAKGDDSWTVGGETFADVPRLIDILSYGREGQNGMAVLADKDWRTYRLSYLADTNSQSAAEFQVRFGISDTVGKTWFKDIKLQKGSADRWWRDFEHGVVFLNMSHSDWLVVLDPTYQYWHLKSKYTQSINDGSAVAADQVTVGAHEALFLRKTDPANDY